MSLRYRLFSNIRSPSTCSRLSLRAQKSFYHVHGSSVFARSTLQTRELPHFTPSYPNYFSPSRYFSYTRPVFTSGTPSTASIKALPSKGVYRWLFLCSGLTLAVVIVGGVTRLTESGLSITEWRPVTGVLPPLNAEAWEEEFGKYRETPEFKLLNHQMTVEEFKSIFYMEWGHRILGRTIGLAFVLPYAYFVARRRIPSREAFKLGGLGLLLGFQGALGWYMVKSGLDNEILEKNAHPRVSQYRLAAHLGAAFAFFMGTMRMGLAMKKDLQWASGGLVNGAGDGFEALLKNPRLKVFKGASMAVLLLAFVTAMSGAFVAGLDAGLMYNEFPYMGDRIVPPTDEMFSRAYSQREDGSDIWWRNLFENPTTVQFDHRLLATATYVATGLLYASSKSGGLKTLLPPLTRHLVGASFAMANIQAALGISTLLYLVPVHLAATHQAGSVFLLTTLLALVTTFRRPSALASRLRVATKNVSRTTQHAM